MEWGGIFRDNGSVTLLTCVTHLNLYTEIKPLLTQPLSKRCFAVEGGWMEQFLSYCKELEAKE